MMDTKFNTERFHDGMFNEAWADYDKSVVPDAAPQYQRDSLQQAFVAGAFAYQICMHVAMREIDGEDGEQVVKRLQSLDAQVGDFADKFFAQFESSGGRVAALDDGVAIAHVEHFEAPDLRPEDMTDLQAVIQRFIDERTSQRIGETAKH